MVYSFFLREPQYWIVPWILQTIAYYTILGKMGIARKWAVIPFLAEWQFTKKLFKRDRTFWRPFIIAAVFLAGSYYLGPRNGTGYAYMLIAFIVYAMFLWRLYYRLGRSFGKSKFFSAIIIFMPTIFLLILAFSDNTFTAPQFEDERKYGKFINGLRNFTITVISVIEIVALIGTVGFVTIRKRMPRPMAKWMLEDTYAQSKDIVSDDKAVTREAAMGDAASMLSDIKGSRDYFAPDHSKDKNVVALVYVIGSNLEDSYGCASANIRMMQDATTKGDGLTFVMQTGGSDRWFTSGIDERAVGRYTIKDGKVEKAMDLEDTTCMTEPDNLTDFIRWGVKEYPADRYMLVLWDHGGGVPYGYGSDNLNDRNDPDNYDGLRVSEIADCIDKSGVKFDVIGFDACLMQDIEIAKQLEPYADFYLASEETEGGLGWFYTDGFGRLAKDPGMSSQEFGKVMVSTYDQFNTATNDGEPNTESTLSFVDLTMVGPAVDKLYGIWDKIAIAIENDPADFGDVGVAASNAYNFSDDIQIDLIDFLEKLNDTDINDSICTPEEKKEAADYLRACVLYRNGNAAKGVNGMAVAFPYKAITMYTDTEKELRNLDMAGETALFNNVFSIMAVQQKRESDEEIANTENRFLKRLKELVQDDFSGEEWYVKGFEDYNTVPTLVDIPLEEATDGYKVVLPDKTWSIITDCQTAVYQKDDQGRWRYLGSDDIGGVDENGHPMVGMSDTWTSINGHLACYHATAARETDDGVVYTGIAKAKLNGKDDIDLYIEWNDQEEGKAATGSVVGYEFSDNESAFMEKGKHQLKTGDSIEFMFEYYDDQGELVATEPYGGKILVTKGENLKVEDAPLGECDIEFGGILTDAYQRTIMTEFIQAHLEK